MVSEDGDLLDDEKTAPQEPRNSVEAIAEPLGRRGWAYFKRTARSSVATPTRRLLFLIGSLAVIAAVGFGTWAAVDHPGSSSESLFVLDSGGGGGGHPTPTKKVVGTWETLELPKLGTLVCFSLAMDPNDSKVLYAATEDGLYISKDAAATWTQKWAGVSLQSVVIDPGPPSAVYVTAPDDNGELCLQKSIDAGATWKAMTGPTMDFQGSLWIDTSVSPSVLYTSNTSSDVYGVLKSSDGGTTWQGVVTPQGWELALCTDSSIFIRNVWDDTDRGLRMITADGKTTHDIQLPPGIGTVSDGSLSDYILRADPQDPSRVLLYSWSAGRAPTPAGVSLTAVFASSDDGESWSPLSGRELAWAKAVLSAAPGTPPSAIASASTYLAGLLEKQPSGARSTDAPASFALDFGMGPAEGVVVDPDNASTLYFGRIDATGADSGVFKSTDGGATWKNTTASAAVPVHIYSVQAHPLDPKTLYAATDSGAMRSDDGGDSWTPILDETLSQIAMAPSSLSVIYAMTPEGVSRSDDRGKTWTAVAGKGLPTQQSVEPQVDVFFSGMGAINQLLVSGKSPDVLLADTSSGVFRSADGGATWIKVSGLPDTNPPSFGPVLAGGAMGGIQSLYQDTKKDPTFYALRQDAKRPYLTSLFASRDEGLTWAKVAELSKEEWQAFGVSAFDPGPPLVIYANKVYYDSTSEGYDTSYSTDGNTWRSTDGGKSWTQLQSDALSMSGDRLVVAPLDPGTVYLPPGYSSGLGGGEPIYWSTDAGRTWAQLCDAPQAKTDTWFTTLTPTADGTLLLYNDSTIYRWAP